MRHRLRTICPAVIAVGLLVGCTEPTLVGERPTTPSAVAPAPSTSGVVARMPLALVVHPSRGSIDVSARDAGKLREGAVARWADIDGTAGRVRHLSGGSAESVVRQVARDPRAIGVVRADAVDPRVTVMTVDGADPLRTPAEYPLLVEGVRPPRPVTITVTGDIMLARGVADAMNGDHAAPLRPTARELAAADLTIGNLESTLSRNGTPTQGSDSFGADPQVRRGLALAGFDVLSLANNHVGDYGDRALVDTLNRVEAGGFTHVGAGMNRREALRPVVVEARGMSLGIVAFNAIGESPAATASSPGTAQLRMPPRTGPLNRDDLRAILARVREVNSRTDTVIVLPHWGDQYTSRPLEVQRQVAHRLAVAGADVVVGGHPHWVQGAEMVGTSFVAYSLGNFVFDMDFSQPTMEGIVLDLTYWDGELMAATPRPVVIGEDFAPRFVSGEREAQILDDVWSNSYGSLSAER